MTNDLILHVKALKEIEGQHPVPALWAKAFSDAGGDANRAKAQYMKLRVADLSLRKKHVAHTVRRVDAPAVAKPIAGGQGLSASALHSRTASPRIWTAGVVLVVLVGATQLLPMSKMNPFAPTPWVSGSVESGRSAASVANPATAAPDPGDASARTRLGDQYYGGQGVPRNLAAAATWYQRAAVQGYAKAQVNLAVMYKFGEGVPLDYVKAASWFRKAADQGDPAAQVNLGTLYEFGQGVPQDDAEAAKWYRRAADQGDARGLDYLGSMYESGRGVAQDYVEAYKLWSLAVARTPVWESELAEEVVKNRDNVATKMAAAQVAEAQKLTREWKPR